MALVVTHATVASGTDQGNGEIHKSQWNADHTLTGTVTVSQGGTGATTLTGLVKGNGTSAMTTVTAPSGTVVGTSDSQALTNKTYEGLTITTSTGTLTVTNGKTLSASNSITLEGTDSTTMTFPGEDASIGYLNIPQNSKSAAYTLVLADSGKHIFHPSSDGSARIWTIPANSSVAYPVGTAITFINQNGAGTITISITTDTMRLAGAGTTGSRTLGANGTATAVKVASTEWIISGTGLT